MSVVLVLGVNGQDGSYLADAFLRRGHTVVGIGRDAASRRAFPADRFRYVALDLTNAEALATLLDEVRPDVACHFAAVHGAIGAGFSYEPVWRELMQVNVFALHALLEHARVSSPGMRIFYAGSAKVFAEPWAGILDESSPMRSTCLYGVSKLAARDLMAEYARRHAVSSTNLVLFNHDSPRRPQQFFLPTIAAALRSANKGERQPTRINTLDFRLDWSSADEIMDIVADLAFAPPVSELLVASGRTVLAREAVTEAFRRHGHDIADHIVESSPRRDPGPDFQVDISILAAVAGRRPQKTIQDIIDAIAFGEA